MAVEPGLNSVYRGPRPVPPELGLSAYWKGEQASSCGEVGVMGKGLDALPSGVLAALVTPDERIL